MTVLDLVLPAHTLDGDQRASVDRLDADISAIAMSESGAAAVARLEGLRRCVVGNYRAALTYAAGRPADPRWREFIASVTALLAHVPGVTYSYAAERAIARLHTLVEESAELT